MKMRTTILRSIFAAAILTTAGLGTQAFAGTGDEATEMSRLEKRAERLDRRMARMTKKLGLTPAQVTKIRASLETQQASVSDALTRAGGDRKAAKPEVKAARQATRAEIRAVLTADQKKTFGKMKRKHLKRKRARRMAKALGLSDAQKASFKVIRKEARAERKAILAQADGDRAAAKPALKALRVETREKLSNLLSPDQQAKFDALRAERMKRRKARKG